MVEVRARSDLHVTGGDLHDVVRQRQVRPVAVGESVTQVGGRELGGQPRRRRQGALQTANECVRRQRRSRLVVDVEQRGDLAEVDARHPPRAVGDHRDGIRAECLQALKRAIVVGDVPGNEVDRTDRQEFLDP